MFSALRRTQQVSHHFAHPRTVSAGFFALSSPHSVQSSNPARTMAVSLPSSSQKRIHSKNTPLSLFVLCYYRPETQTKSLTGCTPMTSPENSSASSPSSGTSSRGNLARGFLRRRAGIISMSRMHVHGVSIRLHDPVCNGSNC